MATDPEEEGFTQHDADMLAEEVGGAPINYGSTEKAIAALTQRLSHLRARLAVAPTEGAGWFNLQQDLRRDIKSAEADLAHYTRLQEGRN